MNYPYFSMIDQQVPLLQGKYRILRAIGQGGFGRTFLATDESKPNLTRCVIKQFVPHNVGHSGEEAAELFRQEAERLKELGGHPQIPELVEYFEQDGHQYIVQEFVDGPNLEEELALEGPLSESEIKQLLLDVLPVLQFVHSHQVIHRDIKPANLIRRRANRQLVLVDFGASKYSTETVMAKTGTLIGSPAYTAPEQVMGKAVFSSDLYSLGVTCLHLLTQMPPFELMDHSAGEWVWRHYLSNPVSDRLGCVLDKLLERGTRKRYQSAEAVLQDLAPPPTGISDNVIDQVVATERGFLRSKTAALTVAGIVVSVTLAGIGIGVNRLFPSNQPQVLHAPSNTQPRQQAPAPKPAAAPQKPKQAEESASEELLLLVHNCLNTVGIIVVIFSMIAGVIELTSAMYQGRSIGFGIIIIISGPFFFAIVNITSDLLLGDVAGQFTFIAPTEELKK